MRLVVSQVENLIQVAEADSGRVLGRSELIAIDFQDHGVQFIAQLDGLAMVMPAPALVPRVAPFPSPMPGPIPVPGRFMGPIPHRPPT